MLTNERAGMIAKYLADDKGRAMSLLELAPEEAVAKINADGNDFSVEEIIEFGNQLKTLAVQDGELDEDALGNVAGGLVIEGVAIACIALGYNIGKDLAKKYGW